MLVLDFENSEAVRKGKVPSIEKGRFRQFSLFASSSLVEVGYDLLGVRLDFIFDILHELYCMLICLPTKSMLFMIEIMIACMNKYANC